MTKHAPDCAYSYDHERVCTCEARDGKMNVKPQPKAHRWVLLLPFVLGVVLILASQDAMWGLSGHGWTIDICKLWTGASGVIVSVLCIVAGIGTEESND